MKGSNKNGFTLLEAVIALLLASTGLALVFESFGGAAKLQVAAAELSRTQIIAENILNNAIQAQGRVVNAEGIVDGVAWTLSVEPIAQNQNQHELIRIRVLASGPTGREVSLVSEMTRGAP